MRKMWPCLAVVLGVVLSGGKEAVASSFWQSMHLGGFEVQLSGSEYEAEVYSDFWVSSNAHRLDDISATFYTFQENPSEWTWNVSVYGVKNVALSAEEMHSNLSFLTDDVKFEQGMGIDFYEEGGENHASAHMWLSPSSIDWGYASYHEYELDDEDQTRFHWNMSVYGSFGEGREGDLRGLPFVQVPEPATLALITFGGLQALRRRRM